MQLFLTKPEYGSNESARISDAGLFHQISRVLRMQTGDTCFMQYEEGEMLYRDKVVITAITKKDITIQKQGCQKNVKKMSKTTCIIAYPNSAAKGELIVQKLTEIGVGAIVFRKSARSQAKFNRAKKRSRRETIIKEAVEQSRGWSVPHLHFCDNSQDLSVGSTIIVADTLHHFPADFSYQDLDTFDADHIYCFIGPEGGRGDDDYAYFSQHICYRMDLGETVLRMETAAIVSAWQCRNRFEYAKQ